MARPIWRGNISFGLVNIPVVLFSAENPGEQLHFHLLDKKNHSRIHNQRINEKGQEVPWENIQKAYEFEKGKYIVVDEKMLEKTAADNYERIEISDFVPFDQISPIYFAKPYYLLANDAGLKGYILLHDILLRTKRVGIASVVIKTREHLAAIFPIGGFLGMIILRYAKDLRDLSEFAESKLLLKTKLKIKPREMELAEQLVKKMSSKWKPEKYHDNSREFLLKLIKGDIKKRKTVVSKTTAKTKKNTKDKAEIVDFMELLKDSVNKKERTKRKTTPVKKAK